MKKQILLGICLALVAAPLFAREPLDEANAGFTYQGKPIDPGLLREFNSAVSDPGSPTTITVDVSAPHPNEYPAQTPGPEDVIEVKGEPYDPSRLTVLPLSPGVAGSRGHAPDSADHATLNVSQTSPAAFTAASNVPRAEGSSICTGTEDRAGQKNGGVFCYEWLGRLANGLHVLKVSDRRDGSGIFMDLFFVRFDKGEGYTQDGQTYERLLMSIVRRYALGDRDDGKITVQADQVRVGRSRYRTEDVVLTF